MNNSINNNTEKQYDITNFPSILVAFLVFVIIYRYILVDLHSFVDGLCSHCHFGPQAMKAPCAESYFLAYRCFRTEQRSSNGLKGHQVEHHNYRKRTTCMHRKPCNSFSMVNMASSVDRSHARPTTKKNMTPHKMAAILQLSHAALVYSVHL